MLLRPHPSIISIASVIIIKKLKASRTCLIGYSDFISHEWFLIAWRRTRTHMHTVPTSWIKAISRNQVYAWFKKRKRRRNSGKVWSHITYKQLDSCNFICGVKWLEDTTYINLAQWFSSYTQVGEKCKSSLNVHI